MSKWRWYCEKATGLIEEGRGSTHKTEKAATKVLQNLEMTKFFAALRSDTMDFLVQILCVGGQTWRTQGKAKLSCFLPRKWECTGGDNGHKTWIMALLKRF